MTGAADDWLRLLERLPKSRFCELCPHPFLVGEADVQRPAARQRETISWRYDELTARMPLVIEDPEPPSPLLVAVRRRTAEGDPAVITVGRTDRSDVVVPDASVSREHALFRVTPRGYELSDLGAKNGTWVGKKKLARDRPGYQLASGERLRLGRVKLRFLDAAALWDRVRDTPDW